MSFLIGFFVLDTLKGNKHLSIKVQYKPKNNHRF